MVKIHSKNLKFIYRLKICKKYEFNRKFNINQRKFIKNNSMISKIFTKFVLYTNMNKDVNDTTNICCFCSDPCNPCSQSCGRCVRNLW